MPKIRTHNDFVVGIYEIVGNEYTVVGQFKNTKTNVSMIHSVCGHEWEVSPSNFLSRASRCPSCAGVVKVTEEEFVRRLEEIYSGNAKLISNYARIDNVNAVAVDHKKHFAGQKQFHGLLGLGNGNLSYDFYLPSHNLLIEFHGEQHERFIKGIHQTEYGFRKQKEHDKRKRAFAKANNITLLEIWYRDFDKIEEILGKYLNMG